MDFLSFSPQPVVGVDEAGRGCLAGPVFAGAVILSFPQLFKDSKILSAKRREAMAEDIKKHHRFSIGWASVEEIEKQGIHQASLLAMKRAVEGLKLSQGHLLIDGIFTIPSLPFMSQTPVVQGDKRLSPVSAGGIMAKTERDKLLVKYSRKYPQYGFEKHKGYATKSHREAIKKYGPCPIHRKSFSKVKEFVGRDLSQLSLAINTL